MPGGRTTATVHGQEIMPGAVGDMGRLNDPRRSSRFGHIVTAADDTRASPESSESVVAAPGACRESVVAR